MIDPRDGRRPRSYRALLVAIATTLVVGCRPGTRRVESQPLGRLTTAQLLRTCPTPTVRPTPWRAEPSLEEAEDVSLDFLSERSRRTLDVLDLGPAMARLVLARQRYEHEGESAVMALVRARQTLTARLDLIDLEISTVAAEADCHDELAGSLSSGLRDRKEARVRAFTVAAISVGAVFGITSGALGVADLERASAAVAIAGGVTETGLGLGILFTRGSEVHLPLERNLLHEVWHGPDEARLIPPSVWGLMQTPRGEQRPSPREALVDRWRQSGRLGRPGTPRERERIALLFSPTGGMYDIDALELRMELLDQLEAELNLLSADLHELLREILTFDPQ